MSAREMWSRALDSLLENRYVALARVRVIWSWQEQIDGQPMAKYSLIHLFSLQIVISDSEREMSDIEYLHIMAVLIIMESWSERHPSRRSRTPISFATNLQYYI